MSAAKKFDQFQKRFQKLRLEGINYLTQKSKNKAFHSVAICCASFHARNFKSYREHHRWTIGE